MSAAVVLETAEELYQAAKDTRSYGLTIGFTNGCFDLFHPGHVTVLRQARAECSRLFVGVNGTESVAALKHGRPIQPVEDRVAMIASCRYVDFVFVFNEDTPINQIAIVVPDVLIKGGDYRGTRIVGQDLVENYGGRVVYAPYSNKPLHSTTRLLEHIRAQT